MGEGEREVKLRFDVCPGLSVFLTSYSVANKTDDDINKIIMMRLNIASLDQSFKERKC